MVLGQQQRVQLNAAVLWHLRDSGYLESFEALQRESGVSLADHEAQVARLLERKWNSVVRLQRKVLDLQRQLKSATEALESASALPAQTVNGATALTHAQSIRLPRASLRTLSGHRGAINCLSVHPSLPLLLSAGEDGSVRLWDTATGACETAARAHSDSASCAVFVPSGSTTSLSESEGPLLVATGSVDMSVKLWDFRGPKPRCLRTLRGHEHSVSQLALLPSDPGTLLSCSRDGTLKFWQVQSGMCIRTLTPFASVTDGSSGNKQWVRCVATLYGQVNASDSIALASGSGHVAVLRNDTSHEDRLLRVHEHVIEAVAWAPLRAEILLRHREDILALLEKDASEENLQRESEIVETFVQRRLDALKLEKESDFDDSDEYRLRRFLCTASRDCSVRLVDVHAGSVVELGRHDNWARALCWHRDGRVLFSCGDDKSIRAFDVLRRQEVRKITRAHEAFVSALATTTRLVSSDSRGLIHVWDSR
ncbi:MAG: hypothetical protein MHM6MM_003548 [Cercozoa sp. M6MM]